MMGELKSLELKNLWFYIGGSFSFHGRIMGLYLLAPELELHFQGKNVVNVRVMENSRRVSDIVTSMFLTTIVCPEWLLET